MEYFPKLTTELFGRSISPAIIPSNPLHDLSPPQSGIWHVFSQEDPFFSNIQNSSRPFEVTPRILPLYFETLQQQTEVCTSIITISYIFITGYELQVRGALGL